MEVACITAPILHMVHQDSTRSLPGRRIGNRQSPAGYASRLPMPHVVPYPQPSPPQAGGHGQQSMVHPQQFVAVSPQAVYWQTPTPNLHDMILYQVHYYFSPENLMRDEFLRSQMDPQEGWLPIPLLATFNRLRSLTADANIIADALHYSQELEVNQGRVRKRHDWHRWLMLANPDDQHPRSATASPAAARATPSASDTVQGFHASSGSIHSYHPVQQRSPPPPSASHIAKSAVSPTSLPPVTTDAADSKLLVSPWRDAASNKGQHWPSVAPSPRGPRPALIGDGSGTQVSATKAPMPRGQAPRRQSEVGSPNQSLDACSSSYSASLPGSAASQQVAPEREAEVYAFGTPKREGKSAGKRPLTVAVPPHAEGDGAFDSEGPSAAELVASYEADCRLARLLSEDRDGDVLARQGSPLVDSAELPLEGTGKLWNELRHQGASSHAPWQQTGSGDEGKWETQPARRGKGSKSVPVYAASSDRSSEGLMHAHVSALAPASVSSRHPSDRIKVDALPASRCFPRLLLPRVHAPPSHYVLPITWLRSRQSHRSLTRIQADHHNGDEADDSDKTLLLNDDDWSSNGDETGEDSPRADACKQSNVDDPGAASKDETSLKLSSSHSISALRKRSTSKPRGIKELNDAGGMQLEQRASGLASILASIDADLVVGFARSAYHVVLGWTAAMHQCLLARTPQTRAFIAAHGADRAVQFAIAAVAMVLLHSLPSSYFPPALVNLPGSRWVELPIGLLMALKINELGPELWSICSPTPANRGRTA